MLRFMIVISSLLLILGCGKEKKETVSTKLQIVTSNFCLYDFARTIAGDKADVKLLLPAGVEAHSYEPTPKDIVTVGKSDLFICVGRDVESVANTLVNGASLSEEKVLEVGKSVTFLSHSDDDDHGDHSQCEHGDNSSDLDPHIWLDPVRAQKIAGSITAALVALDSSNSQKYQERGDSLVAALSALHSRFEETFAKKSSKTIMYAGHFAFGYFADRYGLEHISPYVGFSPNAEPTPARIAELIKTIREKGISTIYYEELVEPRIARTIVNETGVEMVLLHGIHNVSSEELKHSFGYLKGMEANRVKLEKGLN